MKSIIKQIFTLCAILVLLPSCSKIEDDSVAVQPSQPTYLEIETDMPKSRWSAILYERDTTFKELDTIGIVCCPVNGTENIHSTAVYKGGKWEMQTPIDVSKYSHGLMVYGYWPHSERVTYADDFLNIKYLQIWRNTMISDRSYATVSNPKSSLSFAHIMSKVTIEVAKAKTQIKCKTYGLRNLISMADVSTLYNRYNDNINLLINKVYNRYNNEITYAEEGQDLSVRGFTYTTAIVPNVTDPEAADPVVVVLTLDGKEVIYNLPNIKFKPGEHYTFTINPDDFDPERLQQTIGAIDINGHKAVYLGFNSDNGKPLYWSTVDLHYDIEFEDDEYYPWGSITTTGSSPKLPTNVDNYARDTRYDAATAKWGKKWWTPTRSEWQRLIDNCTVEDVSKYNGCRVIGKNGNSIFLLYNKTHVDFTVGKTYKTACRWSSSKSESKDGQQHYGIMFRDDNSAYLSSFNRSFISIRPVTE